MVDSSSNHLHDFFYSINEMERVNLLFQKQVLVLAVTYQLLSTGNLLLAHDNQQE